MDVSLNGGTPKTPQNDHFFKENPWLLGTAVLGTPHMFLQLVAHVVWCAKPPLLLQDLVILHCYFNPVDLWNFDS